MALEKSDRPEPAPEPSWSARAAAAANRIGLAILICVSIQGVAALGGGLSPALDLLNHFNPFYCLAGGVLTYVAARGLHAGRRSFGPLLALGSIAFTGQAAVLAMPFLVSGPGNEKPLELTGPRVKVVTLNVWERNRRVEATAEVLSTMRADVVALQEVRGSAKDLPVALRHAYPHRADCGASQRWCSLVILSRHPICDAGFHQADWQDDQDTLSYVWADIRTPAGPMRVVNTKLLHPDLRGRQAEQIARLDKAMGELGTKPTVLVGDFNLTPWAAATRRLDAATRLRRVTRAVPTWPAQLPLAVGVTAPVAFLPLDHVYAGEAWRAVKVGTRRTGGSDHYAVAVEFRRSV